MDQAWLTIEETAQYLGRKPSTIRKWAQRGKLKFSLFLDHGRRVRRVVMAEEAKRILALEVPDEGSRPDSWQQKLWNRQRDNGVKGQAARQRTLARRKAEKEAGEKDND